jgi:hypothetical protein
MYADACRFQAMINSWRDLWGMGDFSFIYTQLAPVPAWQMNFSKWGSSGPSGGNWPEMRLAQAEALPSPGSTVDTSGMAVITDLGDTEGPPHPKNVRRIDGQYCRWPVRTPYGGCTLQFQLGGTLPWLLRLACMACPAVDARRNQRSGGGWHCRHCMSHTRCSRCHRTPPTSITHPSPMASTRAAAAAHPRHRSSHSYHTTALQTVQL